MHDHVELLVLSNNYKILKIGQVCKLKKWRAENIQKIEKVSNHSVERWMLPMIAV